MIDILYVDDDETFLDLFKNILERMGDFRVSTVKNGKEALSKLDTETFDLVISDYHMPEMDGIELLRTYRQKGHNIPYILFTGRGREEVVIEAINNGAAFYLQKGGDIETLFIELAHKVRQAVSKFRIEQALLESEERLRLTFESARDGIIIFSDGIISDANSQICKLLLIKKDELLGMRLIDFSPLIQPDETRSENHLDEHIKEAKDLGDTFFSWNFLRTDGTFFNAEVSLNKFIHNNKLFFQAIIRDVTERLVSEEEINKKNIELSAAYEELIASDQELKTHVDELRQAEEQIKESERRYREISNLLPETIYECDQNGIVTYFNEAAIHLFHYSKEVLEEGINIYNVIAPDDLEQAKRNIKNIIKAGQSDGPHQYNIVTKEGDITPVIIHSTPIYTDGIYSGLRGIVIDISDRVKAEEELLESKQRLTDVISFLPDATFVIDKEGKVIMWNLAIEAMTGILAKDILNKGDYAYSIPFYGTPRPILIDLALNPDPESEKRYTTISRYYGDKLVGESYTPGIEGDKIYMWGIATALLDSKGEIIGAIESIRDITDRKLAEHELIAAREELEERVAKRTSELTELNLALKDSEERYRRLVEVIPDAIIVFDADEIIFVNQAAAMLLGAGSDQDLIKHNPRDHINTNIIDLCKPDFCEISPDFNDLNLPEPPIEDRLISCDRREIDVELNAMAIDYEDRPALMVVARDISKKKQAEKKMKQYSEELEIKNQELNHLTNTLVNLNLDLDLRVKERTDEVIRLLKQKDDFINQLGHDLKTPLTPLLALLPHAIEHEVDPEYQALLSVLLRSTYSIRDQTNKILTLARLNRQSELGRIPLNIKELLKKSLDKNNFLISRKRINIKYNIPEDLTISLNVRDAYAVFDNLISNAVKYSNEDGTVSVNAYEEEDTICISFEDEGMGIELKDLNRVFDEFYMADRSRHDRGSSGLGLAIVHRIMELYQGEVTCKSEGLEKGSIFIIKIPKKSKDYPLHIDNNKEWGEWKSKN